MWTELAKQRKRKKGKKTALGKMKANYTANTWGHQEEPNSISPERENPRKEPESGEKNSKNTCGIWGGKKVLREASMENG